MSKFPRITFGIIVLNGEPFLCYNLRALYPFAHQIIVVEGAAPAAASIATPDGHSTDSTLETLRDFKAHEDPGNKLIIITAEDEGYPDGFWPGEKHEQSQAYARRTTGDYLWQVDVDEFYREEDMEAVISMLRADPSIDGASFRLASFWGSPDYVVDGWYLRRGAAIVHRLFRWGPGYSYVTHRPPTVTDERGRDLRKLNWVRGNRLTGRGILLYHYYLLIPKQVLEKCAYYGNADWARRPLAKRWAEECFFELQRPFRVHNVYDYPSWIERFEGKHPTQVRAMWNDIRTGRHSVELRRTDDVERLLYSRAYRFKRFIVKYLDYGDRVLRRIRRAIGRAIRVSSRHLVHGRGSAER